MKKILRNDLFRKVSQIAFVVVLTFLVSGAGIKNISVSKEEQPIITYTPQVKTEEIKEENEVEIKEDTVIKSSLDLFITENEEVIRFFARIFDMNYDDVILKIKEINLNPDQINQYNIGLVGDEVGNIYTYASIDRGILELFLKLEKINPELVQSNYEPYTGNREYVEALVEYFSSLYPEVDHKVMLSIGAAESGYYTAKTMLYKNNIYGGMGSNGLIQYKNIEYGVMSYIKYMADKYYNVGLNTIESIGYIYCPRMENGVKTVSSHWVGLVYKALDTYNYDLRYVSVAQLNDLLNQEI